MTLYELEVNQRGIIKAIAGGETFRRRLISLGIAKESRFNLKAVTMMKNVFEIELESGSCIALRRGEAKKLEVELWKQ